jgi:hypothetical protein
MRAALCMFAVVLLGCETPSASPWGEQSFRVQFPMISVTGPYAKQLTIDDVRQIRDAARGRADIPWRLRNISVVAPDRVDAKTDELQKRHHYYTVEFKAFKKAGLWYIDNRSVKRIEGEIGEDEGPPLVYRLRTEGPNQTMKLTATGL